MPMTRLPGTVSSPADTMVTQMDLISAGYCQNYSIEERVKSAHLRSTWPRGPSECYP